MTAFYFFCSNPFYKVEIFYDGSEKETLMIIGRWFFYVPEFIMQVGKEKKNNPSIIKCVLQPMGMKEYKVEGD